jgi:hypothetical protein
MGGEGVVDHHAQADGDGAEDQGGEHLHPVADALAEPAEVPLPRLAAQMGQAQRALFFALLALRFQQQRLFLQKSSGVFGHARIVPGLIGGDGRGESLRRDPRGGGVLMLAHIVFTPKKAAQQSFSHRRSPKTATIKILSGLGRAAMRANSI